MDKIELENLVIYANHGVFKEEKILGQKFVIDILLKLDTQEAGIQRDLTKSVHYGNLANEIKELFVQKSNDLIETCAEEIAQYILVFYPLVKETSVRIKKPWAPLGVPIDNVFVEITRKKHRVFLGLGSNIGDPMSYINQVVNKIENEYVKIINKSAVITTKAWGLENQPDYKNSVLEIETTYTPNNLLSYLQKIELELGRERKIKWGPRTIDIDILFIDDMKIYDNNLIVPHPYISERKFVLEPLNEIAPNFIHPIFNKPIRILLEELKAIELYVK